MELLVVASLSQSATYRRSLPPLSQCHSGPARYVSCNRVWISRTPRNTCENLLLSFFSQSLTLSLLSPSTRVVTHDDCGDEYREQYYRVRV